jgi:type I restriction enzyme S subunit
MVRSVQGNNVPTDWKYDYLDKFAVRGSGHTPDKEKSNYWNGGIKWVSLTDSSNLDNGFIFETDKEISEEGIKNSSAVLHPPGTVILSRDAGVGKSAVLASPMAVSQHFMAWRCDNSKKMNSWFLYNWLQIMKPEFERQAVGSTIKTIGLPYFKKLKIAVPPYPEQEKIARILSTWNQAISTTEQLLRNSQLQKKALMQQLLTGKKRLPGFNRKWQHIKLEQIFSRITTKNDEGSTNVLTISAQHGLIRQEDFFKKIVASEVLDNYFLLKNGQFAYNKSYSNGYPMGAIKRLNKYKQGVVTTLYICFETICEQQFSPDFFEHYFESGLLNHGLSKVANEGGRAHGLLNVKPSDFFALKVLVPCMEEQQRIAKVLSAAEHEVEAIKQEIICLKQEKKALMLQLLTGKRRVNVNEKEVA